MTGFRDALWRLLAFVFLLACFPRADAGELRRSDLERLFPPRMRASIDCRDVEKRSSRPTNASG